jgi:hypothetical protein
MTAWWSYVAGVSTRRCPGSTPSGPFVGSVSAASPVLAAPTEADLDVLARTVLRRQEVLTLMTAGAIRRSGLELRPTFRRPHYTLMLPDPVADVERLAGCQNEQRANPYFGREEAD